VSGAIPWIAAGGYELGRRVITNPWFWNLLQLYLYGEQEHEIHDLMRTMQEQGRAVGPQQQIPGAPEGCVWPPRVGTGEWYDMLHEIEMEMAANPPRHPHRCHCED